MDYYDYGSTAGLTSGEPVAIGVLTGALLILFFVLMAICLTTVILAIIGQWKIFEKSNQPGWAALIPYYNVVCLCRVAGINEWWVLIYAVGSVVLNVIPILGSLASLIVMIYFLILLNVSLARSFGKSDGYAAGLILLGFIFYFLLGREKEQYLGPHPMHDIVFDEWFKQNNNYSNATYTETSVSDNSQLHFCPNCGYKLDGDTKFCPSCGKEV